MLPASPSYDLDALRALLAEVVESTPTHPRDTNVGVRVEEHLPSDERIGLVLRTPGWVLA